ncbi:hypothetical protein BGP77_12370 [Saccharospirillum sp. MSK14-1]|uniref:RBBP9/YdeN family alpha/beta hydrolase n=1 Tax=Saccharospirillum sp. MSK14-1 TaxID=1897632 RepID=UPI000D3B6B72|nr:alpha/beta fold hydrolase [Saccharospirillum sp. MSK14-1]PTY38496.1 hypothetical protein BGP77_12370 [Saccharospirillum sp. MSK14-1]
MTPHCLILPGYGDSGPQHWQSRWQQDTHFERVEQTDWIHAERTAWVAALEGAVQRNADRQLWLVAHSLGCLTVAFWAAEHPLTQVQGALLVAPPDPNGDQFPASVRGFNPVPAQWLPFPSTVVMSTNDPYAKPAFAEQCATQWGSHLVNLGDCGHINHDSGLDDWPEGRALLQALMEPSPRS